MVEFRKGDIVEYKIAGIEGIGYSGTGMVLDDHVVKHFIMDPDIDTECVTVKDVKKYLIVSGIRTFGRQHVTKVICRREDIKKFWEYL